MRFLAPFLVLVVIAAGFYVPGDLEVSCKKIGFLEINSHDSIKVSTCTMQRQYWGMAVGKPYNQEKTERIHVMGARM